MSAIKIQRTEITFEIFTKARQPLALEDHEKEALREAVEAAVKSTVNMDYHPEGNRFQDERHNFIGVDLSE